VAALATGILTRRNKYQQKLLIDRESRAQTLNQILLDIATKTSAKELCVQVIKHISAFLDGIADVILLRKDRSLSAFIGGNLHVANLHRELAVAKWSMENNKAAGQQTDTLSSAEALYVPLKGSFDIMGALAFQAKRAKAISVEDMDFLFTVAQQIAISLEKLDLRKRALESDRLGESERVHQALLETVIKEFRACPQKEKTPQLEFMMENFLLLSRLFVGVFPLKKETCNVFQLAQLAIKKVEEILPTTELNLTLQGDRESELRVERDIFVHALANLVLNAIQHGDNQGVIVDVKPREILIVDHGKGINEEDLGRVFDVFFRGEGAHHQGEGLGLAIAKGVLKAHQGKITAKNRPGGGLEVSIVLP
jgi:two-component system sensor histidine kinase KdpD